MAERAEIERKATLWPIDASLEDEHTAVIFKLIPGVGNIASRGALGDMTAYVTRNTEGLTTVTADVTHDDSDATTGIIYFGHSPSRGDPLFATVGEMQPSILEALKIVSQGGNIATIYQEPRPALELVS